MNSTIAIDIGATQMRAASFATDSIDKIKYEKIATRSAGSSPEDKLINLIEAIWPEDHDVLSIAAACPGPLDPINGIVINPPNIPEWNSFPLREFLHGKYNIPAAINNDANLAAYGEYSFGAGKGNSYLLYLTISTGVGGGIIVDDKLLIGSNGFAGEIGHMTVVDQGVDCSCGQKGHLEAYSSGPSITNWFKSQLDEEALREQFPNGELNAKLISKAAINGNQLAIAAFERAGRYIGLAIADLLHLFNTSLVIIGGGVSIAGDLIFNPIRKSVEEYVISDVYLNNLQIVPAKLGDDSGLLGALVLSREITDRL